MHERLTPSSKARRESALCFEVTDKFGFIRQSTLAKEDSSDSEEIKNSDGNESSLFGSIDTGNAIEKRQ